ncbi:hypothetical protein K466DRAFT_652327 [Polyporus arcularius HHB13444]|uniref:Uncharacterized protein n=1 Tax=Polyporus arcularius HHB13444 TaxID=1314778 RepID=A0A5C3PL36_9APHY|nr:hypothetical protein K466DRAFT_652327 [Polyporus arcularius HHB13444]
MSPTAPKALRHIPMQYLANTIGKRLPSVKHPNTLRAEEHRARRLRERRTKSVLLSEVPIARAARKSRSRRTVARPRVDNPSQLPSRTQAASPSPTLSLLPGKPFPDIAGAASNLPMMALPYSIVATPPCTPQLMRFPDSHETRLHGTRSDWAPLVSANPPYGAHTDAALALAPAVPLQAVVPIYTGQIVGPIARTEAKRYPGHEVCAWTHCEWLFTPAAYVLAPPSSDFGAFTLPDDNTLPTTEGNFDTQSQAATAYPFTACAANAVSALQALHDDGSFETDAWSHEPRSAS